MERIKNVVVGAGFSGAVIAERIASQLNEPVLVIDKKEHIAGHSYDYQDRNITVHKFGSHIFHTNNEEVWSYVRRFTDFNTYMHKVLALIDGITTTIPFNINSLYDLFPKTLARRLEEKLLLSFPYNTKVPILEFQQQNDRDLQFLADFVYEKVFLHYTTKQWGTDPRGVDGSVTARVPIYISKDSRYFQDKYQGIPVQGYTRLIQNILDHPNITVQLNTDFATLAANISYDRIFYTGSIDEFFHYQHGVLPYRSIAFTYSVYPKQYYQANSVVNYPYNYDFTRIHEYKYYLDDDSAQTIIAKEYSSPFVLGENDRYYPIPNQANHRLYDEYANQAKALPNTYFLGRLGDYKYYDMDKAIARALKLFQELK